MRRVLVTALLGIVAACGASGPAAPDFSTTDQLCVVDFCVTAPSGWSGLADDNTVSYTHPLTEDATVFASLVDMAWMLESTGSEWPASLESVERAYWSLLATPPLIPESLILEPEGWSYSSGRFEGLVRWHSLRPIDGGPVAVALTILLPGDDWDAHARTFIDGVTLLR